MSWDNPNRRFLIPAALIGIIAGGVGTALGVWAAKRRAQARHYARGLIAGDSINASPVLTRALTQLTGFPWDNVAVVGRNTSQILTQVQGGLRQAHYDVVLVSAGGNDGNRDLGVTQRNIQAIARAVRSAGATLVMLSEPPFGAYRNPLGPAALARSQASRRWVLSGRSGANYAIDLYQVLGGGSDRIRSDYNGGDGLHPNAAGRTALAQAVARIVMA